MSGSARIVYGVHPVTALLERRPTEVRRVYLVGSPDPAVAQALSADRALARMVEQVPREKLEKLTGSPQHQGVAVEAAEWRPAGLDDLWAGPDTLILALDSIQDPQNFGALVRSAEVLGASGVLMAQDRSAPVSGAACKAAAGALERIPVARVVNLVRALEQLRERGAWVTGLAGEGDRLLPAVDLTGPTVVVVGAEGDGLRPLVRRSCDFVAAIPMGGSTGSLNASVAGAVALYEATRQRRNKTA